MRHLLLFVTLFVSFCVCGSFGGWRSRAKPHGLDPDHSPKVAVEARILSARTCRDNARLSLNKTTDELMYVIEATHQCGLHATYGQRFMILRQNLTVYQLGLFIDNGYTVVRVADTEDHVQQYNVTWRLKV